MNETRTLPGRVDALEEKSCFAEDLLDQLNLTVYRQQQQIDRLAQEIQLLRQQIDSAKMAPMAASLRDELPPHY